MLSLAYQNSMNHMRNQHFSKKSAFDKPLHAFPIMFDVISKEQLANNKIQKCITNSDPDYGTRIIQ
jgi:hypothetical protein